MHGAALSPTATTTTNPVHVPSARREMPSLANPAQPSLSGSLPTTDPLLAAISLELAAQPAPPLPGPRAPTGLGATGSALPDDMESWLVPYSELTFERLLGQGPTGRVSELTWEQLVVQAVAALWMLPACS